MFLLFPIHFSEKAREGVSRVARASQWRVRRDTLLNNSPLQLEQDIAVLPSLQQKFFKHKVVQGVTDYLDDQKIYLLTMLTNVTEETIDDRMGRKIIYIETLRRRKKKILINTK